MDFFRSSLGENSYYPRAIFDAFAPVVKSAGRANRLVFRLPVRWVLTTNYDLVLNYASPQGTATFTWCEAQQAREFLERAEGASPALVKIHGCASRPDTVVLTHAEYCALRDNEAYGSMIRYVFESMTTLFLGVWAQRSARPRSRDGRGEARGRRSRGKFALLPPRAHLPYVSDFPTSMSLSTPTRSTCRS
jgi:hypothetical protein